MEIFEFRTPTSTLSPRWYVRSECSFLDFHVTLDLGCPGEQAFKLLVLFDEILEGHKERDPNFRKARPEYLHLMKIQKKGLQNMRGVV
jgi:hypothetical protein